MFLIEPRRHEAGGVILRIGQAPQVVINYKDAIALADQIRAAAERSMDKEPPWDPPSSD
jgi:hypothetical protein